MSNKAIPPKLLWILISIGAYEIDRLNKLIKKENKEKDIVPIIKVYPLSTKR